MNKTALEGKYLITQVNYNTIVTSATPYGIDLRHQHQIRLRNRSSMALSEYSSTAISRALAPM